MTVVWNSSIGHPPVFALKFVMGGGYVKAGPDSY